MLFDLIFQSLNIMVRACSESATTAVACHNVFRLWRADFSIPDADNWLDFRLGSVGVLLRIHLQLQNSGQGVATSGRPTIVVRADQCI